MNHPVLVLRRRSDRADLLGPRALGTAADGELDPLVFLKAAVTASLDGGMVDEEVGRAPLCQTRVRHETYELF